MSWAKQQLNRSRCRLGADLCGPNEYWFCPISPLYVKTWLDPQNRKYVMHCIFIREELSHGYIQQVQQIPWRSDMWFWNMRVDWQTNTQTHRQVETSWNCDNDDIIDRVCELINNLFSVVLAKFNVAPSHCTHKPQAWSIISQNVTSVSLAVHEIFPWANNCILDAEN